ncbi:MAG: hypothetical protein A2629_01620 [Candidatus Levybacteria bacterium RIFCSPHIGHO2_01_FULL_41_15]|nr:MAG: hypothetical protein A2629_01620 [Candidatus Levybacteria bacterium RIFCSPHIGHO2_01_FULL_41_15]
MICPKCEEGKIEQIRIKKTGETCSVCSFCHSLWLSEETIRFDTGHFLDFFLERERSEYSIEELEEKDQEHGSAYYKDYN